MTTATKTDPKRLIDLHLVQRTLIVGTTSGDWYGWWMGQNPDGGTMTSWHWMPSRRETNRAPDYVVTVHTPELMVGDIDEIRADIMGELRRHVRFIAEET